MENKNRRTFLKNTAGAAATVGLLIKTSNVFSANEKIRHAVVGLNGRGNDHIRGFAGLKNVEVVALCDVDEKVLNKRYEEHKERLSPDCRKYVDYREMLENKDIDTVSIATPNHWHSIQGIWACQAGKDVYVEKPLSHNIREGRKFVEAARKYNRIVQQGSQIRSSKAIQEAIQGLHEGLIGEVYYAKGTCYKWRPSIGDPKNVGKVPESFNYDLWTGPAPEEPYKELANGHHYDWHWQWNYGNGDIGNQGIHQMDVARWGLGEEWPDAIAGMGGHFMFDDAQETHNTMVATMKYKDSNKMLVFEVRHWITNQELGGKPGGNVVGNLFLGSKGIMIMPSYTSYEVYFDKDLKPGPKGNEGGNHWANFIEAVVKRDQSILTADVLEGHISSGLCHLANAAAIVEDTIHFDAKTESVTNNEEANAIIQGTARGYRSPFELPESV
ncbi:MAG: Gfo/Idh/MocA family protein [bacterium]